MLKELPVRTRGVCCDVRVPVAPVRTAATVDVLKALADPTRLSMLAALKASADPVCICDLVGAFDLGQPTISHHMAILKNAGLVESEKRGIWVHYRLKENLAPRAQALVDAVL